MKSIAILVGAVAAGYVTHKYVGNKADPMFSKAYDLVKKGLAKVKKGKDAAEPVVEAEVI